MTQTKKTKAILLALVCLAAYAPTIARAQVEEPKSPYEACLRTNIANRLKLEKAPANAVSDGHNLGLLILDDQICECIKEEDARTPEDPLTDLTQRYFAANSVCMAKHINKEFPRVCPTALRYYFDMGRQGAVTDAQVQEICGCGSDAMNREVTPANLLVSQQEQFKYFNLLVADRRNNTRLAASVTPPGPGPFEIGMISVKNCASKVLGVPDKH